jgi:isopenicillin N synthase-like dioxygenase
VNQLLARVLGQAPDFFVSSFSPSPLDMLRGFHYHSEDGSDPGKGVFGAGAHTDW